MIMFNALDLIYNDVKELSLRTDEVNLKNKDFLITGASGLLGSYFIAVLKELKKKYQLGKIQVVIQSEPSDFLRELYDGVEIIQGDLSDIKFCQNLPTADFIIHAAGYGQPGKFLDDQIKTLKLNTLATFILFDKLKIDGHFLFLSTSEVYSGLQKAAYEETDIGVTNTDHVRSCYIEGKRCGEAICNAQRLKGIKAKMARLALAYGPGTKKFDKRVLNNFIEKGIINKRIDLLDAGLVKRTYCYVADAVEILMNILLVGKEGIYNVGGESTVTIKDLALLIGKLLEVPVNVPANEHSLDGAPTEVNLNLNRIKNEFTKTKFVSLENGLKNTIAWQKNIYSN